MMTSSFVRDEMKEKNRSLSGRGGRDIYIDAGIKVFSDDGTGSGN